MNSVLIVLIMLFSIITHFLICCHTDFCSKCISSHSCMQLSPFPLRIQNMVSSSMRAKLAAYSLALLLHLGHMTADLTLLHRDLGITEAR